ncbi:MAG: aminopeptidase [Clostridia bacterium]|nr:aminopeptidase [Clostridia bacterium]
MSEEKKGWDAVTEADKKKIFAYNEEYKKFLNAGKTERECVSESLRLAESAGFVPLANKTSLKAGDKVYVVNKNKAVALFVIGSEPIVNGINIIGAHIDAPRLDLKQHPLFEDTNMAYLKTHYYGGIKKYQWTSTPLAIHGVVVKKDGAAVNIVIGENDDDVTFVITDLLPHLGSEQMNKTASRFIEGESLNLLVGSTPAGAVDAKDRFKTCVLDILREKYGIEEEDFISAEIEAVPSYKARDLGFDRSLVASYAHDDRSCAFPALKAILNVKKCNRTAMCLLVDKEETGSAGTTGARSAFMRYATAMVMEKCAVNATSAALLGCFDRSMCLSADVVVAFDPSYASCFEKNNTALLGGGIAVMKYGGSGGKYGTNDASAEMLANMRKLFEDNLITWQTGEMGKVDCGGGGTIAQYVADYGVETLDCGVPVLSMHATYEIVSKFDTYMTLRAFEAFYKKGVLYEDR